MKIFLILTGFYFSFPIALNAQHKVKEIDSLMNIYSAYGQFDGAVLVAEDGKIIYESAFGLANREWNIPNTISTKFKLASLGKQFTALLIMQLVEEGKLRLDGKVSDYFTDYPIGNGAKITIGELLSHTSGVPNYSVVPDFDEKVGTIFCRKKTF